MKLNLMILVPIVRKKKTRFFMMQKITNTKIIANKSYQMDIQPMDRIVILNNIIGKNFIVDLKQNWRHIEQGYP